MLQKYGKDFSVTNLDKDKQIATLASGKTIHYDALISTMPLDITLTWLGKKQWADGLTHRYVVLSMHMIARPTVLIQLFAVNCDLQHTGCCLQYAQSCIKYRPLNGLSFVVCDACLYA